MWKNAKEQRGEKELVETPFCFDVNRMAKKVAMLLDWTASDRTFGVLEKYKSAKWDKRVGRGSIVLIY